jgi:hypothetical protein
VLGSVQCGQQQRAIGGEVLHQKTAVPRSQIDSERLAIRLLFEKRRQLVTEVHLFCNLKIGNVDLKHWVAGSGGCQCDSPSPPTSQRNRENPAPLLRYANARFASGVSAHSM